MADPATIPTEFPCILYAGDDWRWEIDLSEYPANIWTLTYYLGLESADDVKIAIAATADGTTHSVTVPKATTAAYVAGTYNYVARIQHIAEGNAYTLKRDVMNVRPDYENFAGDTRTYARQMIDALKTAISGTISASRKKYSIGGVLIERMDSTDQKSWLDYFSALYNREQGAVGIENDRHPGVTFIEFVNE